MTAWGSFPIRLPFILLALLLAVPAWAQPHSGGAVPWPGTEIWSVVGTVSAGFVPSDYRITLRDSTGATINGFEVNGNLKKFIVYQKPGHSGSTPTISLCGTSPSVVGNDVEGTITIGGGGAVTACRLTFAAAWAGNAPVCTLTGIGTGASVLSHSSAPSGSAMNIAASADIQSQRVQYHCMQPD